MSATSLLHQVRTRGLSWPLEAASVAAVLALAALLDTRDLHSAAAYDEGVYLASLRELEHGATLSSQLFTSQPPGFYWLLRLAGLFGSSPAAIRGVFVVLALAGLVAIWWLVRSLAGATAGVLAAALLAVTPVWAGEAARIEADPPSVTLALAALALARTSPLVAGALLAAALSVKLLAVSALVPFVLLCGRGLRRAAIGFAVATAAILAPTVGALGAEWRQVIAFHLDARGLPGPSLLTQLQTIAHFPNPRTVAGLLALLAIAYAVLVLVVRRRLLHWRLWAWTAASSLLLVLQRPLFDHHLVLLAAALAAPVAATTREALRELRALRTLGRPLLALAGAMLLTAGALAYQRTWHDVASAPANAPGVSRAAAFVRARLPSGSEVSSDVEIVPYLAGMRQPPDLVDLSVVRVETGSISNARILAESRTSAAFVVGRALTDRPALLASLRRRYARTTHFGPLTVYFASRVRKPSAFH